MIWALALMVAAAQAAKLDNAYLPPPPSAKDAGGSDGSLEVPLEPPYVDPYTPEDQRQQTWRPGTRNLKHGAKDDKFLQNEEEIVDHSNDKKGKFISGSYSYTGPDNVLVTVTYKAANRKDRKLEKGEESYDDYDSDDSRNRYEDDDEEEEEEEEGVIPTPRSLPGELARAFDFHQKKHNTLENKTHKNKKPIRGGHNKIKGQHPNRDQDQQDMTGTSQGYQYPPQAQYGPPVIHQGYSYPKQNN